MENTTNELAASSSQLAAKKRDLLTFAAIVGGNAVGHNPWSKSMTLEGARPLGTRVMLFSRLDAVQKSAAELVLPAVGSGGVHDDDQLFAVTALSLGVTRELRAWAHGSVGVGARGTVNVIPDALRAVYGSRTPLGATIFVRWRPSRMNMSTMDHMAGMHGM